LQNGSARIVWIGIFMNLLFVIPAFFFPEKMCELLGLKQPEPIIWVQSSGMLLFIISIFYIPDALDPFRYRATAIMHIIPSRACGSTFFLTSVLFRGQEKGFLSIALVDLFLVWYPQFSCSWLFGPEIIRVVTHNTVSHRERSTI
jgi:hypothetical protein